MLAHYRETVDRGKELESEWSERLTAYRDAEPDLAAQLELVSERKLPDGWDAELPSFSVDEDAMATRKASGKVIQWAAERVPQLVSGSADLEPSTLTLIEDGGSVTRDDFGGRNVHYGVREHAMGAIVNGLNLHGLRAFGSTFFNFLDYQKAGRAAGGADAPALDRRVHPRLDRPGRGRPHPPAGRAAGHAAGPAEHLRGAPADANETALAWRFAIREEDSFVALVLSRQGLPVQNPSAIPDDAIERGAYVLRDSHNEPDAPELILIATGSEVSICVEAADRLEADGVATRVVSAPCLDRFAEQDADYRDSVLPPDCRARVSVEAASELGWRQWTTEDGDSIGMTSFGASAPQPDLYEHFGFTPEAIADRGKDVVERLANRSNQ